MIPYDYKIILTDTILYGIMEAKKSSNSFNINF